MSEPIFVTWIDAEGCGPDGLVLTLERWPTPELAAALSHPEMHIALHVVIHAESGETYASDVSKMVGGALSLHVEAARTLHRQIGEWLDTLAETAPDSSHKPR